MGKIFKARCEGSRLPATQKVVPKARAVGKGSYDSALIPAPDSQTNIWLGCGHPVSQILLCDCHDCFAEYVLFMEFNPKHLCFECWRKESETISHQAGEVDNKQIRAFPKNSLATSDPPAPNPHDVMEKYTAHLDELFPSLKFKKRGDKR